MTLSADVAMWLIGIVLTVLFGLVLYIWKDLVKKTEDNSRDIINNHKDVNERMDAQSARIGNMITRDEFSRIVANHATALDSVGSVIREMQHSLSQRIDLVLFEMNRNRSDGK